MKRFLLFSVFLVVLAIAVGCSNSAQQTIPAPGGSSNEKTTGTSPKLEITSVTIGTGRDPQLASEIIVAKERGFFKEEGLDVNLQLFQTGADLTTAIAGKSIAIGSTGDSPATILKATGNDIQIIAQQSDISGAQALIVKSGIKQPNELNGKKVAYNPGSTSESLFLKIASKYGLDVNSMKIFKMGASDMLVAFQRGDIDAFVVWEPTVLKAQQMGGVKLLSASDSFIPGAEGKQKLLGTHSVLLANQTFLKDNPETTKAIIRALQKASKLINESMDTAAENVSKTLNIELNDVKTMMKLNRFSLSITPELIDDIKATGEFLKSKGTIKDTLDFATFVNPNFLKGIDPTLVTWNP